MFARFDENPVMTLRVKETKRYGRTHGRTDNVKTVYPLQTKFAGGIITVKGRTLDKLRTFKMFKNNYKLENYLSLKVDKHLVFNLAKFRISNHQLEIETGRYKKTIFTSKGFVVSTFRQTLHLTTLKIYY